MSEAPPHPHKPPSAWERTGADVLQADCRVFSVYTRRCFHPERKIEADFAIIDSPHWIQAIAMTPEGKLILVNQFRFGRESFSWEMPGGLVDQGEDLVAAAARELREETGYVGNNATILGHSSPNPAIQNNLVTFVLFRDCKAQENIEWDKHEEIEVGIFDFEAIDQMIEDGRIHNAMMFNALFFLKRKLEKETNS